MSIEMIEVEEFNLGTQIKVIGVGGGGGNAVEHMISRSVQGVEFICANTDAQSLTRSAAHKTIQLGVTGLGAGSKPEKGRDAAETAIEQIREAIDGAHMLFDEDHRNDDDVAGKDRRAAGFKARRIVVPVGCSMHRECQPRQVLCEAAPG